MNEALVILNLANALEPSILNFVKTLMHDAQGKTAEEFFAEADTIWDSVIAKAQAQLNLPPQAIGPEPPPIKP